MINPIGVTTKKNITLITIGEIIFPKNIPNLNQIWLKGVKTLELTNPRIKKIKEIISDHTLKLPSLTIGYIDINKNTKKTQFQSFYLNFYFFHNS